jgi:small-conductance mechanosensitive channel
MIDYLTHYLPAAVTDYLPEALDNIEIAPASLRKASTWDKLLDSLPSIAVIIVLGILVNWTVKQLLKLYRYLKTRRVTDPEDIKRIDTVTRVLHYACSVFIWLGTVFLVFERLGIAVGPLLGAAGIVGIAVGFGAQSLVKDYFTGLFLIIENQLRQGDAVEVGGKSGTVEEITCAMSACVIMKAMSISSPTASSAPSPTRAGALPSP